MGYQLLIIMLQIPRSSLGVTDVLDVLLYFKLFFFFKE